MWRDQQLWNREDESIASGNTPAVPFLLKLPKQSSGVTYQKTFDTVISRSVVTAILAGRLTEPAGIGAFIEAQPGGQGCCPPGASEERVFKSQATR